MEPEGWEGREPPAIPQLGTHTSTGSPWPLDLEFAYCLIKTFNKIFLKEHKSKREREMMMKVQTKKFHLEQGEKNVYVCKKDAFYFL